MSGAPLELWHILYVEVWLLFTFDKSIKKIKHAFHSYTWLLR